MSPFDARAIALMQQIGGTFARHIAIAWQHADTINERRLERAFGELLSEYRKKLADHDLRQRNQSHDTPPDVPGKDRA